MNTYEAAFTGSIDLSQVNTISATDFVKMMDDSKTLDLVEYKVEYIGGNTKKD